MGIIIRTREPLEIKRITGLSDPISIEDGTNRRYVDYGLQNVNFIDIKNKPTLISGSSQVNYSGLFNIPIGIVSSSTQISSIAVNSINGYSGSVTITAGSNISISASGNGISISGASGSSGSTITKGKMMVSSSISSYSIPGSYTTDKIDIFLNGFKLIVSDDYSDASPPNISFTKTIFSGSVLEYMKY